MPIYFIIMLITLAVIAALLFRFSFTRHAIGEGAEIKTVLVTVIDKQMIDIPEAQLGEEEKEYWIYVQKVGNVGIKREFKIGIHYFEALELGCKGELTYKGDEFMHFALKREN